MLPQEWAITIEGGRTPEVRTPPLKSQLDTVVEICKMVSSHLHKMPDYVHERIKEYVAGQSAFSITIFCHLQHYSTPYEVYIVKKNTLIKANSCGCSHVETNSHFIVYLLSI